MAVSRDQAYSQWADLFQSQSGYAPTAEDIHDFEGKWANSADSGAYQGGGYTSSWDDILGETADDLETRFTRPTYSNGGIGGDADPDGDGIAGGSAGGQGGNVNWNQLQQILDSLGSANNETPDLSSLDPGDAPNFEVPGENLSEPIDNALLDLLGGEDSLGLGDYYRNLLESTAGGGVNSQRLNERLERARENLVWGEKAAASDLGGRLADRGLISLPGSPQGFEADMTSRAFEPLQRIFLDETRQANYDESVHADEQELSALQAATGWSRDQAASRLAAVGSGTQRQAMLSDVALKSLEQNRLWNQFAAQFGLDREKLMYDIQNGRMENLQQIAQLFGVFAQLTRGGYV